MAEGDAAFVEIIVGAFVDTIGQAADDLVQAVSDDDAETMGRIAHSLKPNAIMFGMVDIQEDLLELEQAGRAGSIPTDAPQKAEKIARVLHTVVEELK